MPLLGSFGAGGWATLSGRRKASIYVPLTMTPIEVLLVAGGGGASGGIGGGGGGGGVIYVPQLGVLSTITYIVTVGAGGAGASYSSTSTGGNASTFTATGFSSLIAAGGGGSGVHDVGIGYPGGSGGGAASNNSVINQGGQSLGNSTGIHAASVYGNRGGNMTTARTGGQTKGAGGGGAGGQGIDTDPNFSGATSTATSSAGGVGIASSILGTSYYFGGGGGGGGYQSWGGYGGWGGGGGAGGDSGQGLGGGNAINAGANGVSASQGGAGGQYTGGGGGSSSWQYTAGGAGGSGIVVVRYPDTYTSATTTGVVTETVANGYRTYRFNGAGTIKFPLDAVGGSLPGPTSVSGLIGWYNLDAVTTTQWTDQSGLGNHAVINGATTSTVAAGNGSTLITRVLAGTTAQTILWPAAILPSTYTLFHVTRYTGVTNSRIYQGYSTNWLSGHWGGLSGQFYHQGWLTDNSTNYHANNWAIYTDQNSLGRSNKIQRGTGGGGTSDRLTINASANTTGENSTWQTVECVVYNRTLTSTEYATIENYLSVKYGI